MRWPIFEERRKQQLARQLRQSLQTLTHGLRVGISFPQALERAAEDADLPLQREWRRVLESLRLGKSLEQALADLPAHVPLQEMRWFVTAVLITQSTGGSLAPVLENLAHTLQEREALRDKISALTAQGKASGILLGILPWGLMSVLAVIAPKMVRTLFMTSAGHALLLAVAAGDFLGGIFIYKIVTIKTE